MPTFTSDLAASLAPALLDRFLRYVRVDTQASRDRTRSPSSPGQLELGRLIVQELLAAGVSDASLDDNGYVMATLPGDAEAPVIGFIAHLDTSPDATGAGVEPLVHRDYDGGVIELPRGGTRLDPATMPELREKVGHDLVSTSGDTLLGADDKAGVAAIMTAAIYLATHPEAPRPTVCIAFTPDEEIGEGATLFDLERFGAHCAYTLDGSDLGELQDETFSAVETQVTVHGIDVHPGQAAGRLVSALRLVARIIAELPPELSPERTDDREGFIHPYAVTGTASVASFTAILRDFDEDMLAGHERLLRETAERIVASEPRARLEIDSRRQYSNMRRYLEPLPHITRAAVAAIRAEGIEPIRTPIRGGTDGSRLCEMGLPTPNIFDGGYEFHSVREWASVNDMAAAAAVVVRLAEVWTEQEFRDAAAGAVASAPMAG